MFNFNISLKINHLISVTRTSSLNENDSQRNERLHVKSRPRPGTSTPTPSTNLIAPPPIFQRRVSTTSNLEESSTPDLISFTNPPNTFDPVKEFESQK